MPAKWSAEMDSFILNYILTDPRLKIGTEVIDSMADAWPTDKFGPKPTRKAFTEHFSKIRKANKGLANGISAPATPSSSVAPTPRSRKTTTTKKSTVTKAKGKSKKMTSSDSEDEEDGDVGKLLDGIKIKREVTEGDDETPCKKRKTTHEAGKYEESEEEGVLHPSEDEYKADEVEIGAEDELEV